MADAGTHGWGTIMTFNTAAGGTTALGELISVNPSGIEVSDIDISTMSSTDKWRTFVAGIRNAGELTVEIVFDAAEYTKLIAQLSLSTIYTWTVTLPDTSTFICTGFVKTLGGASPHDDKITQSLTIKLTGTPAFSG